MIYPPMFAITCDEVLSCEQIERIHESFKGMYSRPENAYMPIILESGLKYEKIHDGGPGVVAIGNCHNCGAPHIGGPCEYCGTLH